MGEETHGLTKEHLRHISLFTRILLFLGAFLISIALQVFFEHYQTTAIFDPVSKRTGNIQAISQLLNSVKGMTRVYDEYRWEYGDVATFVHLSREMQQQTSSALKAIEKDMATIGKEQYLLASAIEETFRSLSTLNQHICSLLIDGKNKEAAQLYYGTFSTCAGYLSSYIQQLLEQAITDNQDAYTHMMALNNNLKILQNVVLALVVILGTFLVTSLLSMLRSVRSLSDRSIAIGNGDFDVPDVDESREDEIGDLSKAFNSMKRSMKRQVEILEEKNQMESALYKKENEALGLQNLLETQKLQILRSQVNPHFLFNTLNVINYSAQEEHAPVTSSMLRSLSQLYRYAIGSNKPRVPLSRELNIVRAFASLYSARFGEKMNFSMILPPDLDVTTIMVPSFIIQPLVENAYKYGLAPKEGNGTVKVEIKNIENMLHIKVKDDGVGITPSDLKQVKENLSHPTANGEHIGIYNVAARLKRFSPQSTFTMESEEGKGMKVEMALPLVIETEEEAEEANRDQDADRR